MRTWPSHPVMYEINTWVWLGDLRACARISHPMRRGKIHRTFSVGFTTLFARGPLALPEAAGGVRYPLKVSPRRANRAPATTGCWR